MEDDGFIPVAQLNPRFSKIERRGEDWRLLPYLGRIDVFLGGDEEWQNPEDPLSV